MSFQDFDLKQLIEEQTGYSCGEEVYETNWNLREDSLHMAKSTTLQCYNKDFCVACQKCLNNFPVVYLDPRSCEEKTQ